MIGDSQNTTTVLPEWVDKFPDLLHNGDPIWIEIANRAQEVVLPAGYEVFAEGHSCKNFVFVLEGATRVFKSFESGREMVLYRLHAGETCSLTTSVLLAGGDYPADAVTEVETRAVLIPTTEFHQLFDESKRFRDFVCQTFGGHIRELVMLLEAVTVHHVDIRLARWLVDNGSPDGSVNVSHRELAFEVGTAREVISRHLKEFESRGWVQLNRKNIAILDETALRELVSGCRG
jgi:CRP/FNR family transcriptional regulator